MAEYRRRTRVAAPLDRVWAFHSAVSGLEALTPSWLGLRIEAVRGPDGDLDPDVLTVGSRIEASVQPFGVGPRQRWTSVITEREREDDSARFTDVMEGGPFRRWEHTHRFFAADGDTVVDDHVRYALPYGRLGEVAAPLARLGLEPMFRYRHRRTRQHFG